MIYTPHTCNLNESGRRSPETSPGGLQDAPTDDLDIDGELEDDWGVVDEEEEPLISMAASFVKGLFWES